MKFENGNALEMNFVNPYVSNGIPTRAYFRKNFCFCFFFNFHLGSPDPRNLNIFK